MTAVEAVSNGVTAFREPRAKSARTTLTIIIVILMLMLAGIAYLSSTYRIGATPPGQAGYESVLSQMVGAVGGKGVLLPGNRQYFAGADLSSNTAFAGFPRVCHAIAQNGYLPHAFANRGRRLVYSHGIYVLLALTAALLIMFGGVTDHLIPLFAVGAFLAFTLSQAGMVFHWKRTRGKHWRKSMLVNAVGAVATGVAVIVVLASKFREGAWVTLVLIPGILLFMRAVKRHYERVEKQIALDNTLTVCDLRAPLVVVPIDYWNKVSQKALRFALSLSPDVIAVHVDHSEEDSDVSEKWNAFIARPAAESGAPTPRLEVIKSPYRFVITPILGFVFELERHNPDRQIAVVVPNLVERRWYQRFLHNQRGELLSGMLLLNGNRRTVIVNVPWYLHD